MHYFTLALHIVLSLFLIFVVLLQPGKGGDVGAAFGGGSSSSFFGPRGPASLLSRLTTVVAVLFMCTSAALAISSTRDARTGEDRNQEVERIQQRQLNDPGAAGPAATESAPKR